MTGQPAQESLGRTADGDATSEFGDPNGPWWVPILRNGVRGRVDGRSDRGGLDVLCWSLVAQTGAPAIGREICGGVLREWGMAGLTGDVQLVVSELITNALRHGCRCSPVQAAVGCAADVQLGMVRWGGELICAVRDEADRLPARREPEFMRESGRGLHLVASFARRWGVLPTFPSGKYVWALFA
ncbi:hypothetical protein HNR23_000636 [Nocardiopsis mwathae]|uniref:Histidine kinase/HSP90-like ATPase domain-containing protein n=1 Tax=Nocardiopsis mwathae TaxID=1472723 RepID=A0A7W9YFZ7_9ACTN|nr:hypothetical protein [Nocardiopsis mwathae]